MSRAPAPVVSSEEKLKARLGWVMSTEQGRAAAWWMLNDLCGLYSQSHAGEATHASAFNAGQRQVGIELMQYLKRFAPLEYREMLRECLEVNRDQPPPAR